MTKTRQADKSHVITSSFRGWRRRRPFAHYPPIDRQRKDTIICKSGGHTTYSLLKDPNVKWNQV